MKKYFIAAAIALGMSTSALAGPVLTDLTEADYIVVGNLKWAAAAPISSKNWYGSNELFTADLHAGWREATDAEWAARPTWADFGGKCAAKYWNTYFTHCDVNDILSQHWTAADHDAADLWYVSDVEAPADVPEPASLALLGLGLLGLSAARRRK